MCGKPPERTCYSVSHEVSLLRQRPSHRSVSENVMTGVWLDKCLHQRQLRTVLHRFRHMHLGDHLCPRCQLELAHGGLHQQLAGFFQRAILSDLCRSLVSNAGDGGIYKTLPLAVPDLLHLILNTSRRQP